MKKNRIGIIASMWLELKSIYSRMEDIEIAEYSGVKFSFGRLKGCSAVLAVCGVGKVNAALHTQLLIDRYSPDLIIHMGIAGGISDKVRPLSTVIGRSLEYHDADIVMCRGKILKSGIFEADGRLSDILAGYAGEDSHIGGIITGDRIITDACERSALSARFPNALCVDMESCAVAQTAYTNNIPFCVLRCISDNADENAQEDAADYGALAAERAAGAVMDSIPEIAALNL